MTSEPEAILCPECGGAAIVGVQIRGSGDSALIWHCESCGHDWPRYATGVRNSRAKALIWQWKAEHQPKPGAGWP